MRAVQLSGINQLSIVDLAEPLPAAGEVVVVLRAAALNHRDVWMKAGQYAGLKFPCTPGSDGAGIVVAAGDGVDGSWVGREVIINPSFDWGENEHAHGGTFSILGPPRVGTLAEKIAVPVAQLTAKPAHLAWEEAAALPLAGLTAFRAVFSRARLRPGERVLVTGIGGGVALFALQFAVGHGAEVWVTSSAAEKKRPRGRTRGARRIHLHAGGLGRAGGAAAGIVRRDRGRRRRCGFRRTCRSGRARRADRFLRGDARECAGDAVTQIFSAAAFIARDIDGLAGGLGGDDRICRPAPAATRR
jgi:threonine dehydrogenase-like Zn-dependent dehydrogenase